MNIKMLNKKLILLITLASTVAFIGCKSSNAEDKSDSDIAQANSSITVQKEESTSSDNSLSTDQDTGSTDTKDSTVSDNSSPDDTSIYEGFLNGSLKAIVDDNVELGYDDLDMSYVGQELSIDEIAQNLKDNSPAELSSLPTISYKYFPSLDGSKLLAVQYSNVGIDGDGSGSTTVMILSDDKNEPHITYCYSTWSRCLGDLSDDGIYISSGSGGAGDHYDEYSCFNSDGSYQNIYSVETLFETWIGMNINEDAFEQAYGENDETDVSYTNMAVEIVTIGDNTYYTYGFEDGQGPSDSDKKFLELTSDCDWKTTDEINALIKERCDELGIDQNLLSPGNFSENWTDL